MLHLNNQQLAVHSLWGTKKRMISALPRTAKVMTAPLISDIRMIGHNRLIQVTNNDESTEDDLEVGDDDNLDSDDPLADEDSNFDDFDDEFDDDFQEEESDPDWEHPDDLRPEAPPPSKSPGGRK
jgi:phosphopantothenoylcysteine synthetase/decarboxylase